MKRIIALLVTLLIFLGCNQEKNVTPLDLVSIEGKVYKIGTKKTFTGKIISNSEKVEGEINISVSNLYVSYKENAMVTLSEKGYEGYYKDGIKEGEWVYYSPDNKVIKRGYYKNGYKSGEWIYYSKSEVELYKVNYSLLGNSPEDYFKNEIITSKNITYLKNSDKKISGLVYSMFPSGKVENVTSYKDGVKEGIDIYFYENGIIRSRCNYKGGKLNGKREFMYSNGNNRAIEKYEYGKKVGEWIYYYDNGKIKKKESYIDDKEDGKWEEYYAYDILKSEKYYENGKKIGIWKFYTPQKDIYSIEQYKDGKREGEWYSKTDSFEIRMKYEDDKLRENWIFKDKINNLEIEYKIPIESSLKEIFYTGNHITTRSNGLTYVKEDFKNPDNFILFSGLIYETFRNGRLKIIEVYENGKKNGEWIYYHDNGKIYKCQVFKNGEKIDETISQREKGQ